ncbi:MAG: hypothetical protein ACFE0Q_04950 [Anaerolineae bacterium]
MWMQFKKIYQFKAQWRWLSQYPAELRILNWTEVPHRTTLSRRYKALYDMIQVFSAFLGQDSDALGQEMSTKHLNEDQSLFKVENDALYMTG